MSDAHPRAAAKSAPVRLVVLWIDWYAYHVARFEGLLATPSLAHQTVGIEFVGGIGVHAGLKFREPLPAHLPVETLLPETSWGNASKPRLALLVWRALSRLDPAAVLVPGYYTLPALAAAVWARAHHRRSLLMTESTAFDHQRVGWREALKSALLRLLFDGAVTGGTAHRRYLAQLGFPMQQVVGCYDVVDNTRLAAACAALPSEPRRTEPSFLYVGRLAEEKNISVLLQAWIVYRTAGGTWPLVLVGDGPAADALRAQVAASGLGAHVHLPGLRGSRELPGFYAAAGCFVLPSSREPWGLVVNEAMACGLPVLVSDRCGCAEDLVAPGRNGFTFSPGSAPELADLLQRMTALSENERSAMGRESIRIIAAYTPQCFGQQIASALSEDAGHPPISGPDTEIFP